MIGGVTERHVTTYVIDASVAAEYLLLTPLSRHAASLIENAVLIAPALIDAETLSVFRRALLRGKLTEARAAEAVEDLSTWPLERVAHTSLLLEAWKHRHNLSAYDSMYVALAKRYGAPLLTADGPLANAPKLGVVVQNIRLA